MWLYKGYEKERTYTNHYEFLIGLMEEIVISHMNRLMMSEEGNMSIDPWSS